MDALRNILVLMEPGRDSQPAFDDALRLARRSGARLELLVTDEQDLHAGHHAMLQRHSQQAAAQGVVTIGEALRGAPCHELVLARVAATRPDLVVLHSVHHNRLERTLFTGPDWHLVRDCPAPLLLVKEPSRLEGARILACVDPQHAHDKPAALDHQLLGRAGALAALLGGEVHALHVFSIPTPVTVVGDAYVAAAAVSPAASSVESATAAFRKLLAGHSIPAARGHLKIGSPAREILAQAADLDAGLVVMGAVSRGRLDRWFVGSTAEAVLDRLACSVWVEKPAQS